jgi:ribonuclease HI
MKPHAYLFTDGSCAYKADIGAYAAVAATANSRKLIHGTEYPSTITRCELLPIVSGLRWIKANWAKSPGFRVTVISDSEITVRTLCGEYERRKHLDLLAGLDEITKRMKVTYIWRERNSLPYMSIADAVCSSLRKATHMSTEKMFDDALNPEKSMPEVMLPNEMRMEKE